MEGGKRWRQLPVEPTEFLAHPNGLSFSLTLSAARKKSHKDCKEIAALQYGKKQRAKANMCTRCGPTFL